MSAPPTGVPRATGAAPPTTMQALHDALERHADLAIAVSGGVDSMVLAHVAWRRAPERVTMVHATGPAVPASAGERVRRHAARHGWPLVLLDAGEQQDARYRANPVDRCYYCKTNLYARIRSITTAAIASGTNRDDLDDFRPGLRAADEHGVVHPYVEAALRKADVYAMAASLGLDDLEQLPAQPCLASRVETGLAIEAADLAFVDTVEAQLAAVVGSRAVIRCRVTHAGVVVELGDADPAVVARATELAASACTAAGRPFRGVRRYVRGAAFLRGVAHA